MSVETFLKLGVAAAILLLIVIVRVAVFLTIRIARWLRDGEWPSPVTIGERLRTAVLRPLGAAQALLIMGVATLVRWLSVAWRDGVLPFVDDLGNALIGPREDEIRSDLGPGHLGPPV